MNTEEMLQEVDRRAADGLLEHLLPKAVNRHAKSRSEYRNCTCDYCQLKHRATSNIANMIYPRDYNPADHISVWNHDYEYWEIKAARREGLREHYRSKLKALADNF